MFSFVTRAVYELKKNSLPDLLRKVVFYVFGKGRYLWAYDQADWLRKKHLNIFPGAVIPRREGKDQLIVFVLPGLWIAGGIAVILQHANRLAERGYRVKIVTQDLKTEAAWFERQQVEIIPLSRIGRLVSEGIDILIATGWNSVPTVDILPARRKLYFVQSDERRFYTDAGRISLIGETYRTPFEFIVMARFLARWLQEEFGQESVYVPNGLDIQTFKPSKPIVRKGERLRVLIEGPIDIPFKGVVEAYDAVKDLDCEIWFVSGRGRPKEGWQYEKFFEKVSQQEMPRIYSSCDILLKMSTVESFAYPPLEMMACGGVPVILEVSGIEEYAKHEENCLIVKNKTEARQAVARLMADRELYARLQRGGLETAKQWGWEHSVDALEAMLLRDVPHP